MKSKKIALIVDNPKRDLPACVLLAYGLALRGLDSYLIPMNRMTSVLFKVRPDYVLFNYLRVNNEKIVRRLINCGIQVGVLDTEGGIFNKMPNTGKFNFFNILTPDPTLRAKIKDYFCWGSEIYEAILDEGCFSKEQLSLSGTPRIDFLHPNFQSFHSFPEEEAKDTILINSSFPIINPKFSSREQEMNDLRVRFNYPEDFLMKLGQTLDVARSRMVSISMFLADAFPDLKFVFRPHPFENEHWYQAYFKNIKNLHVTNERTVDEWLTRAIALIHYECSTAIEANLLNIPVFSYSGVKSIKSNVHIEKVTHFLNSDSEFREQIEAVLQGKYEKPVEVIREQAAVRGKVYGLCDGNAHVRVVEKLYSSVNYHANRSYFCLSATYQFYYRVINRLKRVVGKGSLAREKSFTECDVEEVLSRIIRMFNQRGKIATSPLKDGGVWVHGKTTNHYTGSYK